MNIYLFIYLIFSLIFANLFQLYYYLSVEFQLVCSSISILFIGIPHGTLDHKISFKNNSINTFKFYSYYIGSIFFYLVLWYIFPVFCFIFFILNSSFHFGETQFNNINFNKTKHKFIFYVFWGLSIIVSQVYYNYSELITYVKLYNYPEYYFLNLKFIEYVFLSSNIIVFLYFYYNLKQRFFTLEILFSEIFFLLLVHITSYIFPLIICFTLFFIILHSLPSMESQYIFFKKCDSSFNYTKFILLMLPYSFISCFSSVILILLSYYNYLSISIPLLAIIIISVITLPHSIVMYLFNSK